MIRAANMQDKYKYVKSPKSETWNEFALNGDVICMQCSRMTCQINKREDELTSLLRHIRNAFAHGRIYIKRNKKGKEDYIMLEDLDKSKKLSARIVTTFKNLETWKAKLEGTIAKGE